MAVVASALDPTGRLYPKPASTHCLQFRWKHVGFGRDLTSLVRVEAERRCGDRVTTGTRSFIPACPPRPPLLKMVRRCRSTENVHHWGMDIAFRKDDNRIHTEQAVPNMVILKRIAYNT